MSKIDVITIDSGVPVPLGRYPILELKVGDSFLFPISKRPSVQSRANKIKSETGREFTVKKMDEDSCRIWRTK